MSSAPEKRRYSDFIAVMLLGQLIIYVATFLDIPIVRQVAGFLYFTFIPGFIIVRLLRMDGLDRLETILFSIGLSIAFLMLIGLLVNEFGFLLGLEHPLSLMTLTIVLNGLILVSAIFLYVKNRDAEKFSIGTVSLRRVAFLAIIPFLGFLGAMYSNVYGSNWISLALILAISLLFVVGLLSRRFLPVELYPLAVLVIAIALLFSSSLISKYVVPFASDVNLEYFVFKTTQDSAHWSSTNLFVGDQRFQRLNGMLSITILPTIYSNLLNLDGALLFKIVFPLLFSLVPLALYKFWKTQVSAKYAFIAAFLFMVESTFYTELLGLTRQMIAELFFVLLLLVIFNNRIRRSSKAICFMIFSIALVASHYAIAEIFLAFIFVALVALLVLKKPCRNITIGMFLLFFVVMFSWYIYTTNSSTYNAFVSYADYVLKQQTEFFNPASRGQTVLRGLGIENAPSVWNTISRVVAYTTEALIVVGFLGLITRRVKVQEKEYLILSVFSGMLLGAIVLLPGLANTFNMTRFYHILLFFLAPLCVMGGEVLVKLVSKRRVELKVSILLLIVLVPYFLFQTGFVYEIARTDSYSLTLSMYRMDPYRLHRHTGYIFPEDVYSAQWMSKNVDIHSRLVYADASSQYNILLRHCMMLTDEVSILSNTTEVPASKIVYLNWLNVAKGIVAGMTGVWNTSEFSPMLDGMDKIYSNGASEIYKSNLP